MHSRFTKKFLKLLFVLESNQKISGNFFEGKRQRQIVDFFSYFFNIQCQVFLFPSTKKTNENTIRSRIINQVYPENVCLVLIFYLPLHICIHLIFSSTPHKYATHKIPINRTTITLSNLTCIVHYVSRHISRRKWERTLWDIVWW